MDVMENVDEVIAVPPVLLMLVSTALATAL